MPRFSPPQPSRRANYFLTYCLQMSNVGLAGFLHWWGTL